MRDVVGGIGLEAELGVLWDMLTWMSIRYATGMELVSLDFRAKSG